MALLRIAGPGNLLPGNLARLAIEHEDEAGAPGVNEQFPLLPFETSLRQIALLEIPNVDLGAHADGPHLKPDRIETNPLREADLSATVLVGDIAGTRSPQLGHTPLLGVELCLPRDGRATLPLDRSFEHGVLAMSGAAEVSGVEVVPGSLLHLGTGLRELSLRGLSDARLMLLGGEPFDEPLVMWWNFVGRSHEEIVQAREDWMAGRRFGPVAGDPADPLPAPPMPTSSTGFLIKRSFIDPPSSPHTNTRFMLKSFGDRTVATRGITKLS